MRTYNKQLFVHKNETFTLDYSLVNNDGSPYVISSLLNSPYFLLSVASSRYSETSEGRYLYNHWLSARDLPRFVNTTPLDVGRFYSSDIGSDVRPTASQIASSIQSFNHDVAQGGTDNNFTIGTTSASMSDLYKFVKVTLFYKDEHNVTIQKRSAWYKITNITTVSGGFNVSLELDHYYMYQLYPNGFDSLSGLPAGWYKTDEGSFKHIAPREDNEYMYTFNNQYKYYKMGPILIIH